ncbi:MAG: adenylate/guanylate cyclase domain-containing protein [Gammaproteobacteria bacterium]|nr:adenylate/guanylate cyclase domain-containing protein [Gammaproteobacteria bacterium]
MFADITGSSQLYEKLGDQIAADCVNQCLHYMGKITDKHTGVVIKSIGDEILSKFSQPSDAVNAAIEIQELFSQKAMNEHNVMLSLRIGIHYGDIINRESDVFGDVVNVAARVASMASSKQILTSDLVAKNLSSDLLPKVRRYDNVEIRGTQKSLVLYDVVWQEQQDMTMVRTAVTAPQQNSQLTLLYKGKNYTIECNSPPFVMGRSKDSDLIIETSLASRVHAYLTYRRGKFILIDKSTNGTFVRNADNREVYLRREETPLVGRGVIAFGESTSVDNGQMLQYVCL